MAVAASDDGQDVVEASSRRAPAISTALPRPNNVKSKDKLDLTQAATAKTTSPKKRVSKKNRTPKNETPKAKKTPKATNREDLGDEQLRALRSEPSLRTVQVKQRSFVAHQASSTAIVAIGDSTPVSDPTVPSTEATDVSGGFASGYYGMLLETKRAEKLCRSLALRRWHLARLSRAFRREDPLGTGEITTDEFFSLLHEQPRQLTKGLFEHVGLPRRPRALRFDDFVLCVVTLACWSKAELLHYAFLQFDVDASGVMDGREFRAFCAGLKSSTGGFYFAKNIDTARRKLVSRDRQPPPPAPRLLPAVSDEEADTFVDLADLAKGTTEFQVAFYPLMQLQQNARDCALGQRFWMRIALRRQQVETAVRHMRVHDGKLPVVSLADRLLSRLLPLSKARAKMLVYDLATAKFVDEVRQREAERWAATEAEAQARTDAEAETRTPS
ncbi:hypothetical protein BBJ28_00017964 [Nothophytophthora sp. Chile5]|nr:hypothetical protein BBJ28_00017964 [Nothophytophthora sp. Chile5]